MGSKGTANFVIKWVRDARSQANLNVIEELKNVSFKYTGDPRSCPPGTQCQHNPARARYIIDSNMFQYRVFKAADCYY